MDYAITGTIFTLIVFAVFIGIVIWAYSKKSKVGFDEVANLIFADEDKKEKRESGTHEELLEHLDHSYHAGNNYWLFFIIALVLKQQNRCC